MDIYRIKNSLQEGRTIFDLPLRVAFYARVSTEKDCQLHSFDNQLSFFAGYITAQKKWSLYRGYWDEGISGCTAEKRQGFMAMIADGKAGRFDLIITKEISRFSRNTLDSIRYTQELLACGVGVFFLSDNINTFLPDADLRLTIMAGIAQDEVRRISQRVRFGLKKAIDDGKVLGGGNIWGYTKQGGRLQIDETEAGMVREVFRLYVYENRSMRAISELVVNRLGRQLAPSTIKGILSNPKYKGWYCGNKTAKQDYRFSARVSLPPEEWVAYPDEEAVPPIVSEELWEAANEKLRAKSSGLRGKKAECYPYSRKIRCGIHGTVFYRGVYHYKTGDREFWRCREYMRKGKAGCSMPIVYTEDLERRVKNAVGPQVREKALRILREALKQVGSRDRAAFRRERQIFERYAAGEITTAELKSLLDSAARETEGALTEEKIAALLQRGAQLLTEEEHLAKCFYAVFLNQAEVFQDRIQLTLECTSL